MTNWKHTSTTTIPMDTELGRVITYHEGLLSIKSRDSFVTWSCEITWQTKSLFPLPQYLWLPNMASWWLTLRASHPRSHPTLDHVVLRDHVTNLKHVSTTTIPMATKLGRVVTYNEELALIKLHDPSFTLFWKVTWQINYLISPLAQDQWPQGCELPWEAFTHKST